RDKNLFTKNNDLHELTKKTRRLSASSKVLEDGSWWTFAKDKIYYVNRDPFEQKLVLGSIPLPIENRNITKGFENISLLGKDHFLVGSNVGYIEFSLPLEMLPAGELSINSIK